MAKNLGHAQKCVETTRFAVRRESILMAATGKKVAEKANASKHLQVITYPGNLMGFKVFSMQRYESELFSTRK